MAYGKGGDVSDNGRGDRIGTSPHWVAEEKSVEVSAIVLHAQAQYVHAWAFRGGRQ